MTPTVSVDAVQVRLIWEEDTTVAVRPVGAVGATVSELVLVVVVNVPSFDVARLPDASFDLTL